MLDGGSGVNSTTEELVLQILEENRKAGIGLADKRHPIKKLEKWKHREALRGVAGGASVPLLGSVVMAVQMLELGKDTGPEVLIRFKICKSGTTDWVGWILGARCIDCPERGGLGFVPLEHSHSFTALGIQMKRSEHPGEAKPDQCYAIRASVFDSDDESEVGLEQVGGIVQGNADDSESEHLGTALLYEGDPISLAKGSAAWVPVVAAQKHTALDTETLVVLQSTDSPVEVVPGIWGTGDEQGVVCVVAENEFDTSLEPGTKIAELHSASIQTRVCQSCGCQDTDAWVNSKKDKKCSGCGMSKVGGPTACRQCGATAQLVS